MWFNDLEVLGRGPENEMETGYVGYVGCRVV